MKPIERRLSQLEQDIPARPRCFAWANAGETTDQAIARQFPEGVPETARLIVFQWGAGPPDSGGRPQ
jgi:hypothetical protein